MQCNATQCNAMQCKTSLKNKIVSHLERGTHWVKHLAPFFVLWNVVLLPNYIVSKIKTVLRRESFQKKQNKKTANTFGEECRLNRCWKLHFYFLDENRTNNSTIWKLAKIWIHLRKTYLWTCYLSYRSTTCISFVCYRGPFIHTRGANTQRRGIIGWNWRTIPCSRNYNFAYCICQW